MGSRVRSKSEETNWAITHIYTSSGDLNVFTQIDQARNKPTITVINHEVVSLANLAVSSNSNIEFV